MVELSLVIPFYNEEKNLSEFLSSLTSLFDSRKVDYGIIAVNNGSTDRTGKLLDSFAKKNSRIKLVTIPKNIGYSFGITSGLKLASGKYVGYCWGDGQIVAEDVYKVFEALKEGKADICKIKRVYRQDSFLRRLESSLYNLLYRVLFSLTLKDINGCPKIMRREVLAALNPVSRDWFIDAELMIKAFRKKFKVLEIPVTYYRRNKGKSHVRLTTSLEFIKNALKFKLRGY